ncbi:AraC family transcriptional regulator [Tamlana nanhaiensis]|uniref:AraC family transcriptional regulator n=1 Tax=Neotamlana nanhaiensis TaxID=1382798 RepID=A0A0D7W0J9_9FLAO|nr:helix-turn-helix domain-containing protein [Tamlana nanhaiensis]KJD32559.1 AraC family transcriptional regulator [Tamlana nanhaiensis]
MQHFKTIAEYCKAINISPPKQPYFDIRSFEENMSTVVAKMPAFKHEFYSVAIKVEGSGIAISGHFNNFPEGATVFFNIPFQVLSWDILLDWKGYYLMFSKEFISQSKHLINILDDFPFLKISNSEPFKVKVNEVSKILKIYEDIYEEHQNLTNDSSRIIEAQVLLLLNVVKRYFLDSKAYANAEASFRKADINLLSRYQSLIESSFKKNDTYNKNSHSPSYYANKLAVHPNHLNATIKRITGYTAKDQINKHIIRLAKSRLIQTKHSIKEIAFDLHFNSPNNFSSFFKKQTGFTPNNFRKSSNL